MRIPKLFVFIFVIFLLQTVVLTHLRVFGGFLNPLAVAVVIWALLGGVQQGLLAGMFAGILLDIASGSSFFYLLSFSVLGTMSGVVREGVFKDENTVIYAVVFLGGLFLSVTELFVISQVMQLDVPVKWTTAVVMPLLNTAFVPLIKKALEKINSDG